MVDLDVALTPEVGFKDVTVAVVPPPGAKLPVPGAVQHVEELGVLHADHGEEVLVPEVAAEVVLVSQLLHLRGFQQAAVEGGLAHGLQVQQHHSAVEAGEPLGGRAPNPGLGVLMAELPERVPLTQGRAMSRWTGGEDAPPLAHLVSADLHTPLPSSPRRGGGGSPVGGSGLQRAPVAVLGGANHIILLFRPFLFFFIKYNCIY